MKHDDRSGCRHPFTPSTIIVGACKCVEPADRVWHERQAQLSRAAVYGGQRQESSR